jgi:hypothetical protein
MGELLARANEVLLLALGTVVWWSARAVIRRIGDLEMLVRDEMRAFDRRVTRLETIVRLRREEEDGHGHRRTADNEAP